MNRLYIRKGRLADPAKDNEVVINENFAMEHGFGPGDQFAAVINGKWKKLTITGIALSPEFVLLMRPEAISPDFKRYGDPVDGAQGSQQILQYGRGVQ